MTYCVECDFRTPHNNLIKKFSIYLESLSKIIFSNTFHNNGTTLSGLSLVLSLASSFCPLASYQIVLRNLETFYF